VEQTLEKLMRSSSKDIITIGTTHYNMENVDKELLRRTILIEPTINI